jgi:plastocyanin
MRRTLLISALAATAGLHLALVPEHLREAPRVGVLFILGSAAAIALATLLLWRVTRALLAASALLLAAMIGAYAVAVTAGLGPLGMEREAVDDVGLVCKAVELVGLVAASTLLARPERLRRGWIALGLAMLAAAGGALTPHAFAASDAAMTTTTMGTGATRMVAISGRTFAPGDLVVLVGDTVMWTNGDMGDHTVTSDDGAFDSGPIAPGGSFSETFTKPGDYPYHCTIHRFMRGVVHVYALALTGPQRPLRVGRYTTLSGLAPAGTADVQVTRDGVHYTTAHPAANGSFAVHVHVTRSARFRAIANGARSPVARVVASPIVTVDTSGATLRVHVRPAQPGARLQVEAYSRDYFRWFPFTRGRLGRGSSAVLRVHARHALHLRVRTAGVAGFAGGTSNVVVVSASGTRA